MKHTTAALRLVLVPLLILEHTLLVLAERIVAVSLVSLLVKIFVWLVALIMTAMATLIIRILIVLLAVVVSVLPVLAVIQQAVVSCLVLLLAALPPEYVMRLNFAPAPHRLAQLLTLSVQLVNIGMVPLA